MIAWDLYVGSVGMYPLYICVVWIWRLAWEFVGVFPMHLVCPFIEGVGKRLFLWIALVGIWIILTRSHDIKKLLSHGQHG